MKTFAEIAAYIRANWAVKRWPSIEIVLELADAMDRLEYNVAHRFALDRTPPAPFMSQDGPEVMRTWELALNQRVRSHLESLRTELPK